MRKARTYALASVALILVAIANSNGISTLGFVNLTGGRNQALPRFASTPQRTVSPKRVPDVLPSARAEILHKQARRPHTQELFLSWSVYGLLTVLGSVAASLAMSAHSFGISGAWSHFLADPTCRGMVFAIPAVVLFGTLKQGWQVWQWSLAGGMGLAAAKEFGASQASVLQPNLEGRVAALSARAGLPPGCPRVFVVPTQEPNAFAAGLTPDDSVVAVTEGLLNMDLSSDELDAVLAHEIGHIFNGDCASGMQIAVMVAGFSSLLSMGVDLLDSGSKNSSKSDSEEDDSNALALLMIIAGSLLYSLGYLLQSWHSRRREFVADEAAVALTGNSALASALAKIEEAATWVTQSSLAEKKPQFSHLYIGSHSKQTGFGFFGFVSKLLRSHPKTEERKQAIDKTLQKLALPVDGLPQLKSTLGQ